MFPPAPQTSLEAFWRGQNRRFDLALHDDVLLFWEPDSPQFQSEPQDWVFAVDYQLSFSDESQITPSLLSSELEWALANNRVGRRFQLADTLTVFLHAYNRNEDEEEYLQQQSFVLFKLCGIEKVAFFPPESEVFEEALSEWIKKLQGEEFNRDFGFHDFANALSGADIPFSVRIGTNICVSQGTESQMERLAEIIFQLSPKWIKKAERQPKCEGSVGMVVFLPIGKPVHYNCGAWTNYGFMLVSHPCACLWDIWLDHFAPTPDTHFHAKDIEEGMRLFTRSFGPSLYDDRFDWERYCLYEPSMHEQMELKLELRDWLRDEVGLPDQRIAELLA